MKSNSEARPWGYFERLTLNEKSTVKLLEVRKRRRLSLQFHKRREEFWKVIQGTILVEVNGAKSLLREGESITIPAMSIHRMEALEDSRILEISTGPFAEEDIVRLEDDYFRAETLGSGNPMRKVRAGGSARHCPEASASDLYPEVIS
jgi:mannose-6-phosphate isomerase-like protein (cupin superfamily)